MMSLWDALRMNMMISYQELVRTFLKRVYSEAEFERRRQSLMKRLPKKQTIRMGAYRGVIMSSLARPETKFGQAWL
ncbi:hypothetical protein ABEK68_28005 [Klebsiella pneumoniae]